MQFESRPYRCGFMGGNKGTGNTEVLDSRRDAVFTEIPGHPHSAWRGDSLISSSLEI